MDLDPQRHIAEVAIIGGGAAGLLAGIAAARAGAQAVVYERMAAPGRKIAIAGGGRCNFTNTLSLGDFVRRFGDRNAPKLGHALRAFSNGDLVTLLARQGVEGQVEQGFRIFTKSGRGDDVVQALARELKEAGGLLVCKTRISNVKRAATGLVLEGRFGGCEEQRAARTVVICTGGLSYPATGSTGDGYAWARALGHTVTPLRAALVGLATNETWPRELQGLSWPDAEVAVWAPSPYPLPQGERGKPPSPYPLPQGEREKPPSPYPLPQGEREKRRQGAALQSERGEILFTHFGISGPAILDLSNVFVASGLAWAQLDVDFFPEIPAEELDSQLLARLKQSPNRTLANALEGFRQVPARLLERWQKALGPPGSVPMRRLSKETRLRLLGMMKSTTLTVSGTRGVEHGEVTAGGVAWGEVAPATLESRLCPGLYFAGEMLDVAGRCGGFNLQAAFSTGFLAGQSAAGRAQT